MSVVTLWQTVADSNTTSRRHEFRAYTHVDHDHANHPVGFVFYDRAAVSNSANITDTLQIQASILSRGP